MAIEQTIAELWHKYPIAVVAVAGGGALVVFSLLKKNGAQTQAPGVDNTPVTYQIYGSSGGTDPNSTTHPTPIPTPLPVPVGGGGPCPQGLCRDSAGFCNECPPVPRPPGPPPLPGPLPGPEPGCQSGYFWNGTRCEQCRNGGNCGNSGAGLTDIFHVATASHGLFS